MTDQGQTRLMRVRARLDQARLADGTMLALAGVVGIVTGALAAAMIGVVHLVEDAGFGDDAAGIELLLVPIGGAVLVWLISRLSSDVLGSGIVTTMESLVLRGGKLKARVPLLQVLATGAALGTGASGGREAPMVLVGGSIGSTLAQRFHLGEEQVRALVAAGAAAGIGAAFNAPIGGMLFAIEVIVGGLRSRSLQIIVVSSVAGSVVARLLVGEGIIYAPSFDYSLSDPREWTLYVELGLYLAVGLASAFLALLLIRGEQLAARLFAPIRRRGGDLGALLVGGLVVGLIALVVPEVLGDGEQLPHINGVREPVQQLINGGYGFGASAVAAIGVLFVAKLLATLATIGARSAVGGFAPTLFLGALMGHGIASVAELVLPSAGIQPGAYALIGMAAAWGASARAPLTAVLIVFELSGDYVLILPLMLAVGVATFLAERVTPGSVYTLPLQEKGIIYAQPEDVDLLQTVFVKEVMTTNHPTVRPSLPLPALRRRFETEQTHGFAVVSGGTLQGVITINDLSRAEPLLASGIREPESVMVSELMTTGVVTTGPDDEVFMALRKMAAIDVGRIPVVSGSNTYLGILRRGDLVAAYQTALGRGVDKQLDQGRANLRELTGVRFLELMVAADSPADGVTIAEIAWPTSAVVTSIRRGHEVIVPKGAVRLEAGDEIVMLSTNADASEARALFARQDS
ncbi:MAG: CIC family chloride channel protein [Myxococcota bacterium]|jgi:CIC family chloride channel protein